MRFSKCFVVAIFLASALLSGCAGVAVPRLRNVSIEADVSTQIAGDEDYTYAGVNYHGGHLGRVAIALDQPLSRSISYRLGLEHASLLDTSHDRGEERAWAGFVWRPFAH
jgi:hypothetical protein